MTKLSLTFPAILRWNKEAGEWRLLNILTKAHIQEFKLYECDFMQKQMIKRLALDKENDQYVRITMEKIENIIGEKELSNE